ncbi:MAG: DUF6754 domain-containing protein, partial [Planctomycetaceae bacterium]
MARNEVRLVATVLVWGWLFSPAGHVAPLRAQSPVPPPRGAEGFDHPGDNGTAIDLRWDLAAGDTTEAQPRVCAGYEVERQAVSAPSRALVAEDFRPVARLPAGVGSFIDRGVEAGREYRYRVATVGAQAAGRSDWVEIPPVRAVRQWFATGRTWFAVVLATVCGAVVVATWRARSGRPLYVRPIAALQAMHEAVGRATEMGRPCLFITGMEDMKEIATVAGVAVLSHVAQAAAEYDTQLLVPTTRSLVMSSAQEAVSGAYWAVDRPARYNPEDIYYVSDEQFAFVAHVTGLMVRERPAACFYAGVFSAESLILAETGNSVGAIQIAGTSEAAQLPFFVAAC